MKQVRYKPNVASIYYLHPVQGLEGWQILLFSNQLFNFIHSFPRHRMFRGRLLGTHMHEVKWVISVPPWQLFCSPLFYINMGEGLKIPNYLLSSKAINEHARHTSPFLTLPWLNNGKWAGACRVPGTPLGTKEDFIHLHPLYPQSAPQASGVTTNLASQLHCRHGHVLGQPRPILTHTHKMPQTGYQSSAVRCSCLQTSSLFTHRATRSDMHEDLQAHFKDMIPTLIALIIQDKIWAPS